MELNGYTLAIRPGTENSGYVEMEHNTQYNVFLINDNETRCDATLSIDGVVVGIWRIEAEDSIKLERGVDDKGRFTFYKLGSREGNLSELVKNESLGLIECVFRPEDVDVDNYYDPLPETKSVTRGGVKCSGQSAGGTGLSGRSNQNFGNANQIKRYADQKTTTIYLRLVCKDTPEIFENIRPLRKSATNIPRPII